MKAPYQKPQAVKELEAAVLELFRQQHPTIPEYAIPPMKYRDDTANGLTKCVVDFIRIRGGQAERINTVGIPEQRGRRIVWRRANSTRGSADISAVVNGLSLKVEVKIGLDRQSDAQRKYQASIERAGGLYFIARNFTSFVEWFDGNFKRTK